MLVNQMLLSFGTMFASQVGDVIVGLVSESLLEIMRKELNAVILIPHPPRIVEGCSPFLA